MAASPCAPIGAPADEMSAAAALGLPRERELDLESVVDLDRLPAQERRRVPAVLERIDDRTVHEGQALHDPAIAHHSLRADDALDDHQPLDLALEGLRGVLRIGTGHLLRRRHRVVELDGAGAQPPDLAADLPADDSAHHAADHASLDAALDTLVLLSLLHRRRLRRLLFDLGNLLRLDHGGRGYLRLDPLRPR